MLLTYTRGKFAAMTAILSTGTDSYTRRNSGFSLRRSARSSACMCSPCDIASATFAGVTCKSRSMGSKSVLASQLRKGDKR